MTDNSSFKGQLTDAILDQLRNAEPDFLPKAKKKGYICPVCGNGAGSDGDGITKQKGDTHYKCFRCGLYEDTIGLYGLHKGITDFRETAVSLADYLGVRLDQADGTYTPPKKEPQPEEPETDFTDYILQAAQRITETDYHRGISLQTLQRYKIGYDPAWKHPKAPAAPASPRLIIPTSRYSYIARDTREEIPEEQKRYSKSKAGSVHPFNLKAVTQSGRPVFITEGELDALSVIDVGGHAAGLGGVSNVRLFLDGLAPLKDRIKEPILISLDNDKAGKEAAEKLKAGLEDLNIPAWIVNPSGNHKDANEALQADRGIFQAAIRAAEREPYKDRMAEIDGERASSHLQDFINGLAASVNNPPEPTGFSGLDQILDGGLYPGLYIVGAVSSLGKTTLVLQMADNIAAAGRDVIFFSMEMARSELIAKSISRNTFIKSVDKIGDKRHAKTVRQITNAQQIKRYTEEDSYIFQAAVKEYAAAAEHMIIKEGIGDIGADQIREVVEEYTFLFPDRQRPILFIDYLQILAPHDPRSSDKQNTDKAVLELKRISRDFNIPVVAVSSFNRDNYTEPVNLAAFKESGAIEYGSDVLIGLQLSGMDYKDGEKDGDRLKRIRALNNEAIERATEGKPITIQAKILKNRNGGRGSADLYLYSKFNYIEDAD